MSDVRIAEKGGAGKYPIPIPRRNARALIRRTKHIDIERTAKQVRTEAETDVWWCNRRCTRYCRIVVDNQIAWQQRCSSGDRLQGLRVLAYSVEQSALPFAYRTPAYRQSTVVRDCNGEFVPVDNDRHMQHRRQ
jgi:hypothetical protein